VEYLRNFYGAMDDAINGGTETDRMLVHWDLASDLAVEACAGRGQAASFAAERDRGARVALSAGLDGAPVAGPAVDGPALDGVALAGPALGRVALDGPAPGGARTVLVRVPADIEATRLSDPALAGAWRTALREALSPLLDGGGRVTGFDRSGWYVVSLGGDVR
jgi:predicted GNAT superfamily acetyltransferase